MSIFFIFLPVQILQKYGVILQLEVSNTDSTTNTYD